MVNIDFLCVRLPFLHPRREPDLPQAKCLCVGLPASGGAAFWRPADYPYSETEAAAILREFRNLGVGELESMRLRLSQPIVRAEISRHNELAALASFMGAPASVSTCELMRRQAHKILIWLWLFEENLMEIGELEASCLYAGEVLKRNFEEPGGEREARAVPEMSNMEELLPWRACAACAAYFIPADMPVLAEGPMLAEMLDALDFQPALDQNLDGVLLRATGPLWRALGHSRPAEDEYARDIYNAERIWLGLSDA